MGGMELVSVTTTADDIEQLARLARSLVEERLIACANLAPGVRSIYRWEGTTNDEPEALAVLHTTADRAERVVVRVRELHPYDTPQILVTPVLAADPGYADWVREATRG